MKKAKLLVGTILGCAIIGSSFGGDYYSTLSAHFDSNTRLKIGTFYGWTSGRCVSRTRPTELTASILVSWQDPTGVLRAFVMLHQPGEVPIDHYDVLRPEIQTAMEEVIQKWGAEIPPMLDQGSEWTGTHPNGARVALRGHPTNPASILASAGAVDSPKNRMCEYTHALTRP